MEQNINENASILLALNTPVALVVGAGTFLGSHLVDQLLLKNIQVIGLVSEDFAKKENLSKAVENKDVHLISNIPLGFELQRLDYLIIVPDKNLQLSKVLRVFKESKCRLLLISSVELYGASHQLRWLQETESEVAGVAHEHKLNARILRLGPVYGPRMEFSIEIDPIARLIQQSLTADLQKEISLEFSTRALYIDDAIDLAIKCIFAGATAQKIFDGVMPTPIKVAEVKQVLLDPWWYESKAFVPSELPPWPTPNLEKTIKFLNWHPPEKLVENLRKTLSYFKDNEIKVPELESKRERAGDESKWKEEKKEQLEAIRPKAEQTKSTKKRIRMPIFLVLAAILITYSLIWPLVAMGWGVLTFRFELAESIKSLEKGQFEKSLFSVEQANYGISQAKSIYYSLEPLRKTGILKSQFELGDNLSNLATLSALSAQNTILGIQALYQSLSSVTGENPGPSKDYFDSARTYLASADEDLSKAQALIESWDFKSLLPQIFNSRVESLSDRLKTYSNLVKKSRALSILLPEVVGLEGSKSYLVLLQNNMELRPTGGFIGSFAKVSFESGKLKKLEVNDTYAIDGQLNLHVVPPKEIASDLGQKDYFLRDSNWEPDFPTAARQAEWFYTKETGERVEGVVALDISAIEDLLTILGSADNLFEKAISNAEEKSFLTALTQSLFNKLFFLPNQNWPAIAASLGRSLEQKHMSVYLDNPKLFSYLVSQNWSAVMPREGNDKKGILADFLAPVEANLGANKANYYLDRNYNLETVVGKDGEVNHRLRIAYTNRSPSDAFPGGKYKNRIRVYLPFGTKLNRVLWGESNITGSVSSFVDYGRSGYSVLLELLPKEQKTMVMDYQIPQKLKFDKGKASYRLDVVKQAGTLKDPLIWKLSFPLNYKLEKQTGKITPQEQIIETDLSKDRSFEVEFSK